VAVVLMVRQALYEIYVELKVFPVKLMVLLKIFMLPPVLTKIPLGI